MKIALIGSTAFLATALLQRFRGSAAAASYEWLLCSRKRPLSLPPNTTWRPYNAPALPFPLQELMACDVIYFCAGAGIQPKHQDSEALIYELNTFEPIRLVQELLDRSYSGKLVTFGSYFEIGDQANPKPCTEQQLATHQYPLPNAYCRAKNLLTRFADNHLLTPDALPFAWQHFILTNIYGFGENPQRLIPYIVNNIVRGEALEFTSGVQQRQYTHIKDVAAFLEHYVSDRQSGIFNLTDPTVYRVREVIETTLRLSEAHFGALPPVTFGAVNKRDEHMKYLALDMQLTQNCFTFEPQISLEQGIQAYFTPPF